MITVALPTHIALLHIAQRDVCKMMWDRIKDRRSRLGKNTDFLLCGPDLDVIFSVVNGLNSLPVDDLYVGHIRIYGSSKPIAGNRRTYCVLYEPGRQRLIAHALVRQDFPRVQGNMGYVQFPTGAARTQSVNRLISDQWQVKHGRLYIPFEYKSEDADQWFAKQNGNNN